MSDIFRHILIVLLPLLLSNILHMLIVKYNYFSWIKTPIWAKIFGENKTWRGLIFLPIVNSLLMILVNYIFLLNIEKPAFLGLTLGMAYILFELPNSFLKRKLGISSGEQHYKYNLLFSLLDKMDSAFGVCFTYFLIGYVNYQFAVLLFIISSLTHILISQFLVILKIKKKY